VDSNKKEGNMEKTVGNIDRTIRIILGIILILIPFIFSVGTVWKVIFIIIGIMGLFTGITRICFLYNLLGISTLKGKN
jgi:heme/copper-type cytochrome/quinol oxidase subunit 4